MRRIRRLSSLARPLDRAYRTNEAVVALSPVAGAAGFGVSLAGGAGFGPALAAALVWTAAAFGAWALGREVAPDDDPAAFVAMALATAALLWMPFPSLWLLATAILLARLVNRTVGPAARPLDTAVVVAVALVTSVLEGAWVVALVATAAFVTDTTLHRGGPARHRLAAVACLLGTYWVYARVPDGGSSPLTWGPLVTAAAFVSTALFLVRILTTGELESRTDVDDERLDGGRVRAAMMLVLLLAVPGLLGAAPDLARSSTVWVTLGGVGLAGLRSR